MTLRILIRSVLLMLVASTASAKTTCHEDEYGNKTCCEQWKADVLVRGQKWGLVVEDSYDKLMREIESGKKTNRYLCRGIGPQDSSCATTYGAPECADRKKPARLPPSREEISTALSNASRLLDTWETQIDLATKQYEEALKNGGGRNPYAGIGSVLKEYGEALNDALGLQKRLREMLNQAHQNASEQLADSIASLTQGYDRSLRRIQQSYGALPTGLQSQFKAGAMQGGAPQSGSGVQTPNSPSDSTTPSRAPADACPDLTHCLQVVDSTWDNSDPRLRSSGSGRMTVKVANTCQQTLRLALWLPMGSDYSPQYFQIPAGATVSKMGTGTRNEWQIQASQANASDSCLKYP